MESLGILSFIGVGMLTVIFIFYIPRILYIYTLYKTLKLVSHHNQRIAPALVWLYLIPIFGSIFYIFLIVFFSESLGLEFRERNIHGFEDKPGFTIGLTCAILFVTTFVPIIGILTGLVGFVCWIIHWVKIAEFKRILTQSLRDDFKEFDYE